MTAIDDLHAPVLLPHLLVKGLESHDDRPCFFLGDTHATYKDVRERTSQFIQALASLGVSKGSPCAILSANRPEVLYNMAATSIAACRNTALHPLGSLEDHAYVLNDAGIETLVFDAEYFGDHVRQLADLVPSLKNLLAIGGDGSLGQSYAELADQFEPQPLVVPPIDPKEI